MDGNDEVRQWHRMSRAVNLMCEAIIKSKLCEPTDRDPPTMMGCRVPFRWD